MALARARLEGCAVVLASATPSLESAVVAGVVRGGPPADPGWLHVALPARHGGAAMPEVRLVDLLQRKDVGVELLDRVHEPVEVHRPVVNAATVQDVEGCHPHGY